ncbi:CRISPR-associated protein [Allochromatium humboldtianum]|uniref:CRISPR-associated protein n=1 Tax=Allochromatium humboldtianum TaxID=504901 RepID=A0A850RHB3_9GAMM|nr:TM1802 family CRISPR-associated protein [Allochromatium humboldtianum]NVZ11576.1 CRISPR-associated protein [Allochromatium humboldtianum]
MFHRLYELARCLPERAGWERLNEGMPDLYDRGLALCFGPAGEWRGVRTYQGSQGVLYRSGPPNGTDFTPCCKLAGNTANRLAGAVAVCAEAPEFSDEQRDWLSASLETFHTSQNDIWAEVETARRQAGIDDKTHRGYVYWADELMRPVHGWPEMRERLVRQVTESFADKGGARDDGCCAVCGRESVRVYGNYAVLACYNLNNPGSIAGGFRANAAHRNFPVCGDCALSIADTFTFANTYLASRMAGQTYLILPYSNSDEVREQLRARLSRQPQRYSLGQARDLVADEWELLHEFGDQGDQLALALIFYRQQNAAWRVQAEVQHLLPSRLHELHDAARRIERAPDLIAISKKDEQPVRISALTFKTFAGGSDNASEETLRDWLAALFAGESIARRYLLHALVARLIDTGKRNPSLLHWMTRHAWGLYRYARHVRFILDDSMEALPAMSDAIPNSPYGNYVREHADFFRRPELVVAFLTGCYAAQVTSVQRQERGADPFAKKFVGRVLTRQHLQRLYREGHAKLAQYGKLGYVIAGLDPDLANAWVVGGDTWAISDEEATFAFTIGYSLAYRIGQLAREAGAAAPAPSLDAA